MTNLLPCLLFFFLFTAQPAYAQFGNPIPANSPVAIDKTTGDVCPLVDNNGKQLTDYKTGKLIPKTSGLTRRIVPCIENIIIYAANQLLLGNGQGFPGISSLMANTTSIMCILAIALMGALLLAGKASAPVRDVFMVGLKIGVVVMFTINFASPFFDPTNTNGGFLGIMLDIMNYLMGMVSNYVLRTNIFADNSACLIPSIDISIDANGITTYSPNAVWDTVDCMLEILIGGIYSPGTLLFGLIGFFIASFLSNAIGFFIGAIGFYLIIQLILAIARASYGAVSATIGFSIMAMLGPFFVPLILFRVTRAYFLKWVRLSGSFLLQPMIIFAYLAMLVVAFDTVVYSGPDSLYRTIAGAAVGGSTNPPTSVDPNFQMGQWLRCGANNCPTTDVVSCDDPHPNSVYCRGGIGNRAIPINLKGIKDKLDPLKPADVGEMGRMGQILNQVCNAQNDKGKNNQDPAQTCSNFFFNQLGIGGSTGIRFFRIGMPVTIVDWDQLAKNNGTPNADVTTCILNLFLSLFMAAVTVYIFMALLDILPFIAAGLSGNPYSTPFGSRGMVPKPIEKLSWNPPSSAAGFSS